jgi:hypothetical protein
VEMLDDVLVFWASSSSLKKDSNNFASKVADEIIILRSGRFFSIL